jgi:hypothetical protein
MLDQRLEERAILVGNWRNGHALVKSLKLNLSAATDFLPAKLPVGGAPIHWAQKRGAGGSRICQL